MATKLTCPDCGGVLGPAEPGESSCICFNSESFDAPGATQASLEESLSDTHPVETLTKLCFKCGADVAGKKRYKDSRGYMCSDCNRAEVDAEKAGTAICSECGRRIREAGLTDFRGMRVCKLCLAELRNADKKKIKVITGSKFEAEDRKTLKILIVILIVLAGFIVLSFFKHH